MQDNRERVTNDQFFDVVFHGEQLGRKWTPGDVTLDLARVATAYVGRYKGDFAFLLDLKLAIQNGLDLTNGQVAAVLNTMQVNFRRKVRQTRIERHVGQPKATKQVALGDFEENHAGLASVAPSEQKAILMASEKYQSALNNARSAIERQRTAIQQTATAMRIFAPLPVERPADEQTLCQRCKRALFSQRSIRRGVGRKCMRKQKRESL